MLKLPHHFPNQLFQRELLFPSKKNNLPYKKIEATLAFSLFNTRPSITTPLFFVDFSVVILTPLP